MKYSMVCCDLLAALRHLPMEYPTVCCDLLAALGHLPIKYPTVCCDLLVALGHWARFFNNHKRVLGDYDPESVMRKLEAQNPGAYVFLDPGACGCTSLGAYGPRNLRAWENRILEDQNLGI